MRFGPLNGLVAVILAAIAFALQGDTPGVGSSGFTVRLFYTRHDTAQGIGLYLLLVAGVFLVFFAGSLRHALATTDRSGWLPDVALAGGALAALGFWISAGLTLCLIEAAGEQMVGGGALQALNVLSGDLFMPFLAGVGVMLLAAGLSTARSSGPLPHWLGWIAFVLGVLMFIPFAGFIGLGLAGLWVIAVSVWLAGPPRPRRQRAEQTR